MVGKLSTFLGHVGGVGKYWRMCTALAYRGYPGVLLGGEKVDRKIGRIHDDIYWRYFSGDNILRPVALEMGHRMEAFVADLMTSARSELPELTEDERMAALLEASIVEDVIAVIEFLDDAVGEADIQLPLPVRSFLRVLAQRDVSITVVIRAYRMAQTDFLDQAMSFALTLGPEASPQAIIALVNRTALWIDRMLEQVGEVYEAERDRWVSSRSGLHRQWVETLLTGAGAEVHHAEQALGYRLDTVHLAVAAWLDESVSTRDALTLFDETRSLLAKYVGATGHPLMVPTDEHEVRLWIRCAATSRSTSRRWKRRWPSMASASAWRSATPVAARTVSGVHICRPPVPSAWPSPARAVAGSSPMPRSRRWPS